MFNFFSFVKGLFSRKKDDRDTDDLELDITVEEPVIELPATVVPLSTIMGMMNSEDLIPSMVLGEDGVPVTPVDEPQYAVMISGMEISDVRDVIWAKSEHDAQMIAQLKSLGADEGLRYVIARVHEA